MFGNALQRHGRTNTRKGPLPTFDYSNVIGVDYADGIYSMPDNLAPFGQDADFGSKIGLISKVKGYEALTTSLGAGKMLGLHGWLHSTGDYMLGAWDTGLYYITGESSSISKTSRADWEAGTPNAVSYVTSAGDIQLEAGIFNETDTADADFTGTHGGTEASGNKVTLSSAVVPEAVEQVVSATHNTQTSFRSPDIYGQSFTTLVGTTNISKIKVGMTSGTGIATMNLYSSVTYNEGNYTITRGTLLGSIAVVNPTAADGYVTFTFTTPIPVSGLTQYYYEIVASGGLNNLLYINNADPYAGGNYYWVTPYYASTGAADIQCTIYTNTAVIGTYTHGGQDVSTETTLNPIYIGFNTTAPAGTSVVVQYCVSPDSGVTWSAWTTCMTGTAIIPEGTVKTTYQVQWRAILTTYVNGTNCSLDDVTVSGCSTDGNWISPVHDLGYTPATSTITFTATEPATTTVTAYVRGSDNGLVFGDWIEILASGDSTPLQRYLQVKFVLDSTTPTVTPTVSDYLISYASVFTKANKLDIGPLGRTDDKLTGNRVRFCSYDDLLLMADGLKPYAAYFTTATQVTGTALVAYPNSIKLQAAGSSTVDDFYNNAFITITGGPGVGITKWIDDYRGADQYAFISELWSTNMLSSNQAGVETDTTGFDASTATFLKEPATSMAKSATQAWQSSNSLKVITPGSTGIEGVETEGINATANTAYVASAYVFAPVGTTLILKARDYTNGVDSWQDTIIGNGAWQRAEISITTGPSAVTGGSVGAGLAMAIATDSTKATTFYIDGLMIEPGTVASDWSSMPDATSTYSIGSALKVRNLGVVPPLAAPTDADSGGGAGPNGAYLYKVTFVNADGSESNPGPASAGVTVADNAIALTDIPVDASLGNTTAKRRIYRTAAGGAVYKYVTEIADNTTTTYTDSTTDVALGSLMVDNNNIPPAACTLVYEFNSYVFLVDKFDMWYGKAGNPDAYPNITGDIQQIPFPDEILSIRNHPTALVVSGENFIATITADGGFIFDSDVTVDTTCTKTIDNNGALSQEATGMALSPTLRATLMLNTNTGIRATIPGLQDDSIESVPLSRNIQKYYELTLNRDQMAGVFWNNYWIISMEYQADASATPEHITFAYDTRTEQWQGPWKFGMSCYTILDNVLYAGSTETGTIYRMFTGSSYAGSNIHMIADLPMRAPAGEAGSCKFVNLVLIVNAASDTTNTIVKVKVDEREATISLGDLTSIFAGEERPGHNFIRTRKYHIPLPKGHTYSVRIEDDSTHPVLIEKVITEYEVLNLSN